MLTESRESPLSEQTMREHRDIIERLSIILDDDIRQFELYAMRLEDKVKARLLQKLEGFDQRYWDFDVDGIQMVLHSDTFAGVSIHTADGTHDDLLRSVAERISTD